jgi:hypothetical protein
MKKKKYYYIFQIKKDEIIIIITEIELTGELLREVVKLINKKNCS